MNNNTSQVVFTNKARCRDCYRCVRMCPVKAIRMKDGQAFVVEERCISCGTCVRQCPQKAKSFRNDLETAMSTVRSGRAAAVSIAPSFAAVYSDWERKCIASALRKLGFGYVAETAIGAYYVSKETSRLVKAEPERAYIGTACPSVVSYIEKYRPEAIEHLVPVVSPMAAHARQIKAKLGQNTPVVFIGPCVAKKAEAARYGDLIECVLTFSELADWFEKAGIVLSNCEQSDFDDAVPGEARLFPLAGGELKTGQMSTDMLEPCSLSVTGFEDISQAINTCFSAGKEMFVEPLFCCQGCINGPAVPKEQNVFESRRRVVEYAREERPNVRGQEYDIDLKAQFGAQPVDNSEIITEEQIRAELEKTGKARLEDQLNCGACGYHSCREKAVAVIRGLAEPQMCMPYMRRLAEQRTDRIIETSPNGIVILDEKLNILSMNPAFKKFFLCSESQCGKRISVLMDPEPFETLATGQEKVIERFVKHDKYNLLCHQIMYSLEQEKQYVGIFVNVTSSEANQEKLDQLRTQTIMQARELFEHQLNMAQRIAQFLGESTARGEKLVANLMQLASDESTKSNTQKKRPDIWHTYTSK